MSWETAEDFPRRSHRSRLSRLPLGPLVSLDAAGDQWRRRGGNRRDVAWVWLF